MSRRVHFAPVRAAQVPAVERCAVEAVEAVAEAPRPRRVPLDRCIECHGAIYPDDVHAGHGLCGVCLHDALRSGWEPEGAAS